MALAEVICDQKDLSSNNAQKPEKCSVLLPIRVISTFIGTEIKNSGFYFG